MRNLQSTLAQLYRNLCQIKIPEGFFRHASAICIVAPEMVGVPTICFLSQ